MNEVEAGHEYTKVQLAELEELRRTVAEQKEEIAYLREDLGNHRKSIISNAECMNAQFDAQSALIEKLGASLQWSWQNLYSLADPAKVIETEEALAAYEQYRNGGK